MVVLVRIGARTAWGTVAHDVERQCITAHNAGYSTPLDTNMSTNLGTDRGNQYHGAQSRAPVRPGARGGTPARLGDQREALIRLVIHHGAPGISWRPKYFASAPCRPR